MAQFVLLIICCGSYIFSKAQDVQVTGRVKDGLNQAPLAGVSVMSQSSRRSVVTNESGTFSLTSKAGEKLEVSYVGYATRVVPVAQDLFMEIILERSDSQLGEVVVTALVKKRKRN